MAPPPQRAAIIGAGRVGSTLGARLLAAGWTVMYGSRRPGSSKKLQKTLHAQPAASGGGITEAVEWAGGGPGAGAVLLTVPGSALATDAACAAFARSLGPSAAGKLVIDATNPLDSEGNELCWSRGRSSAEVLAQCLPESFVYNAFKTVGVEHMARPDGALVTGQRLTLRCAGTAEHQAEVALLIEAVGFEPHWVGGLRYSRNLEALAELYIHLGSGTGGADWAADNGTRPYHFQVLRRR
jgi:predicted dinucleotide-binding enzyme